ncbi:MAG: hypothetical protein GY841_07805 [FCB group bacterium]|nr:hypothetical protein [FCB group bacterium]
MNRELPWEEPYLSLLGQIVTHWGGSRSDCGVDPSEKRQNSTALLVYPVYSGELRGTPFTLQVSCFPIHRPERFELDGNSEYLRIHISRSLACNMEIHNINLLNRRMLAGRTDDLFRTADSQTGDSYYIEVRSDADRALLDVPLCKQTIGSLEPFSVLAFTPTGVYWAQGINNPDQLDFSIIDEKVHHLLDLIDLFTS